MVQGSGCGNIALVRVPDCPGCPASVSACRGCPCPVQMSFWSELALSFTTMHSPQLLKPLLWCGAVGNKRSSSGRSGHGLWCFQPQLEFRTASNALPLQWLPVPRSAPCITTAPSPQLQQPRPRVELRRRAGGVRAGARFRLGRS